MGTVIHPQPRHSAKAKPQEEPGGVLCPSLSGALSSDLNWSTCASPRLSAGTLRWARRIPGVTGETRGQGRASVTFRGWERRPWGCPVNCEVKYEEKPAPQRKKVGRQRQQRESMGTGQGGRGLVSWGAQGHQCG